MNPIILLLIISVVLISGCANNINTTDSKLNVGEKNMNRIAVFETSMGKFKVELFEDKAYITAGNFIKLAKEGFYDKTKFHRVISDFMVQGGDPLSKDDSKKGLWGTGGPGYKIPDEFGDGLKHDSPGILSMANSGPNTGGSQFFITVAPTPWLDGKHAIFGKVLEGYYVVENISKAKADENNRPVKPVVLERVVIN